MNIRYGLLLFLLVFLQTGIQAQTPQVRNIDQVLSFTNADYDMGKIPAGKPLEYNIVIKNISKDTVVLQEVKVGCGCTSPKYRTGDTILPGKTTFITLGFNGGANGEFAKTADVFFSGGLFKTLRFHGNAVADSSHTPGPAGLN